MYTPACYCLERDHWNYVTSMDEDKALQVLSAKPTEFAKYPCLTIYITLVYGM